MLHYIVMPHALELNIHNTVTYTGFAKKMYTHFNKKNAMLYVSNKFNYTSQVKYKLQ